LGKIKILHREKHSISNTAMDVRLVLILCIWQVDSSRLTSVLITVP